MKAAVRPAPVRETVERLVALGALPYLCFTRDATDAAVFALGLMGGVALALIFRQALGFLGRAGRTLAFLAIHPALACLFAVAASRFLAVDNDGFLLLSGNALALAALEADRPIPPAQVSVATSAAALLLFAFGSARAALESGRAAASLLDASPFEPAFVPAWIALFLAAASALLAGREGRE